MGRFNGRADGIPGFPRGVPVSIKLVGEDKPEVLEPAKGRYYYHMPVLVQRPGQPMQAEAFESYFPMPINGVYFQQAEANIAKALAASKPDLPAPAVVLLAPFFIGFIPQEELDRRERERATAAAQPDAEPGGESPVVER